jgi:hypothetical protein
MLVLLIEGLLMLRRKPLALTAVELSCSLLTDSLLRLVLLVLRKRKRSLLLRAGTSM